MQHACLPQRSRLNITHTVHPKPNQWQSHCYVPSSDCGCPAHVARLTYQISSEGIRRYGSTVATKLCRLLAPTCHRRCERCCGRQGTTGRHPRVSCRNRDIGVNFAHSSHSFLLSFFLLIINLCISYFASTRVADSLEWYSYMLASS